jgi:hypothetical protein
MTRFIFVFLLLLIAGGIGCRAAPDEPAVTVVIPPTSPATIEITVYFTDVARYAAAEEPYETAVTRTVPGDAYPPAAVLTEFFKGPTDEEREQNLEAITSGFAGFDTLSVGADGVAHVYLEGECVSLGATYTVAQPIMANLLQFDAIQTVKIYDADGTTGNPDGPGDSIPFCLEP